jgi:hypothetical protein
MAEFVYLIECKDLYKIGRTNDLTLRLIQYFTHNPYITKMHVLITQNSEELENYFLNLFAEKKAFGLSDWFALTDNEKNIFVNYQEGENQEYKYKPINRSKFSTSSKDEVKRNIILLLYEKSKISQSRIRAEMRNKGYGDMKIRNAISEMEAEGVITSEAGSKGAKLYRHLTQPAPDAGESAPLQALSTPEHSAKSQNLSTPPQRG